MLKRGFGAELKGVEADSVQGDEATSSQERDETGVEHRLSLRGGARFESARHLFNFYLKSTSEPGALDLDGVLEPQWLAQFDLNRCNNPYLSQLVVSLNRWDEDVFECDSTERYGDDGQNKLCIVVSHVDVLWLGVMT